MAAAYSRSKRLSSVYSGPIIGVRNGAGFVEPIGTHLVSHQLDIAAIAAHCGATHGTIAQDYDQSGNGYHRTSTATLNEPKIYDGATGHILEGALSVALHSSTTSDTAGDLTYNPATMLGLTGKPSLTVFTSGRQIDVAGYRRFWTSLGGAVTSGASFHTGFQNGNPCAGLAGSTFQFGSREFTAASPVSNFSYYITQLVSGGMSNTLAMRQNGVLLSHAAAVTPIFQVALAGNVHAMGACASAGVTHGNFGIDALTSTEIYVEGYAQGVALEALIAEGDYQLAAAGVSRALYDLTSARPINVLVWGQSNADGINSPEIIPTDYGFTWLPKVVRGGSPLDPWFIPGGAGSLYPDLVAGINASDPRVPLVLWKIQGEADSGNPALIAAYTANMTAIRNGLIADTGRSFYWLDTVMHAQRVAAFAPSAEINTQIVDYAAAINTASPGTAVVIDPTPYGSLDAIDNTHYNEALDTQMPIVAHDAIIAAGWR